MLSLNLPSRAVLMHVFIRTFKLKIYFLEFSGLFYYSVIKVLRSFPERLCFPWKTLLLLFFQRRVIYYHIWLSLSTTFLFLFSIEFFNFQSSLLFYLWKRYLSYHYLLCLSTTFSTYFRRTLTFQSFLLSCFVCDNGIYFTTSFSICQHFFHFLFLHW